MQAGWKLQPAKLVPTEVIKILASIGGLFQSNVLLSSFKITHQSRKQALEKGIAREDINKPKVTPVGFLLLRKQEVAYKYVQSTYFPLVTL